MYARVVRFTGSPEALEGGIAAYREQVLPYVREATGFRGQSLFIDREGGRAMSITLWTTEEALRRYDERGGAFGALLAETWGTPVTAIETYEVAVAEPGG